MLTVLMAQAETLWFWQMKKGKKKKTFEILKIFFQFVCFSIGVRNRKDKVIEYIRNVLSRRVGRLTIENVRSLEEIQFIRKMIGKRSIHDLTIKLAPLISNGVFGEHLKLNFDFKYLKNVFGTHCTIIYFTVCPHLEASNSSSEIISMVEDYSISSLIYDGYPNISSASDSEYYLCFLFKFSLRKKISFREVCRATGACNQWRKNLVSPHV